jgi:hypothetical protein
VLGVRLLRIVDLVALDFEQQGQVVDQPQSDQVG